MTEELVIFNQSLHVAYSYIYIWVAIYACCMTAIILYYDKIGDFKCMPLFTVCNTNQLARRHVAIP